MKDFFLTRSLLLSLMLLFSGNLASNDANLEYKIKAGYLYNFTKFITWPELKSPTFNLCILGVDPFGDVIDPIEKKTAFDRSIKIVRMTEANFLANKNPILNCQILYLGGSTNPKGILEVIHHRLQQSGTLVVGDSESTVEGGKMINFVNRDGKIKLQIDLQSVKQTELKISAKLLEIAELIKDTNHE